MFGLKDALGAISGARSAIVTGLAVAGLCLPLGYCKGHADAALKYRAEKALVTAKALETDAHARDAADRSRVADALQISNHEKDLVDAISNVPDDAPDRVRVALGCQRLRGQGTAESDLPAICRP
tara:strand:- start:1788 stop:2162 length:375 start_codon:yes stop_codon:yes gene_type:complete